MSEPEIVGARDPRYRQALDDYAAQFGFRIDEVLLPTHFCVVELDGEPTACVNEHGWRALALLSPDPGAPERIDRQIAAMKAAGQL